VFEAQAAQPKPVALTPCFLAAGPGPAAAQQHLAQAMATAHQILVSVLAGAAQVAHRLVLGGGRMHFGQKPRAQQLSQLAGIATIGLDPIARLARNQRRSNDNAVGTRFLDPALKRVAAGTRLVAEANLVVPGQALHLPHHAPHRRLLVGYRPLQRFRFVRQQHRQLDRYLVRVHSNEGDTLLHDRLLSYAALVPRSHAH
jgi:hypothetical protein